jgi:hypothetical protein
MLTRYKGQLKFKDWAFDRPAINDAQSARRSGSPPRIIMHAMLRDGTEFASA